jgi:hypothetical protein
MTVATGIEIGAAGRSEPGQGLLPAKSASKTSNEGLAGLPGSAAASFLSNWQSQLASLGTDLDDLSAEEGTVGGTAPEPKTTLDEPAASALQGNPARVTGSVLSLMSGGIQVASAAAMVPARNGVQLPGKSSPQQVGAIPATANATQAAGKATHERWSNSQHTKSSASVIPAEGIIAAPAPILSPAMPISVIAGSIPMIAGSETRPQQAGLGSSALSPFNNNLVNGSLSDTYPHSAEPGNSSWIGNRSAANAETTEVNSMAKDSQESTSTGSSPGGTVDARNHDAPSVPNASPEASNSLAAITPNGPELYGSHDEINLAAAPSAPPIGGLHALAGEPVQATRPQQDPSQTQQGSQTASTPASGDATGQAFMAGQGLVSQSSAIPGEVQLPSSARAAGGSSNSVQPSSRTSHGPGAAGSRTISIQAQLSVAPGDAPLIVHDPAVVRDPANPAGGNSGATAEPPLREAFAALDSGSAAGTPTWTHASAHQAEAGFEDPALGWIGVRADRNGGGVHAALVPGSAAAAEELGTHLEGINTYLAAQHTPLESLGMAAPEGRVASHGAEQNLGQGMDQGTRQETGQGTGQNTQHQAHSEPETIPGLSMPGVDRLASVNSSVQAVGRDALASLQTGGGVHISVMA